MRVFDARPCNHKQSRRRQKRPAENQGVVGITGVRTGCELARVAAAEADPAGRAGEAVVGVHRPDEKRGVGQRLLGAEPAEVPEPRAICQRSLTDWPWKSSNGEVLLVCSRGGEVGGRDGLAVVPVLERECEALVLLRQRGGEAAGRAGAALAAHRQEHRGGGATVPVRGVHPVTHLPAAGRQRVEVVEGLRDGFSGGVPAGSVLGGGAGVHDGAQHVLVDGAAQRRRRLEQR